MWRGARRQRNVLAPERGSSIAFALCGQIIEQVCRLAIVRPGQAKIQHKVLSQLPVVAKVEERIMLAEIERWRSRGDTHAVRCIGRECLPISKAERAIQVGQEGIGRALVGVIHAAFKSVLSHYPVQVVLSLPGVYDSPLREGGLQ